MTKLLLISAVGGVLAAAGLGSAAAVSAVPTQGASAADTIQSLQNEGYIVQINGIAIAPLSKCRVLGIHGLSGTEMPTDEPTAMPRNTFDTVYVDVSCPTLSS